MGVSYQVRLFNEAEDIDQTVAVQDDRSILETAEEAGMDLPYSCRQGVCSTCTTKLIEGAVDQSERSSLSEEQMAEGYVLICVAYPKADCVLETHKEEELFD
ncbi:ferredoxin [Nostoc punctiforme NIES-2108]|uniref:Ferredoxin n=1 Tax=Nostoc punctiforme NIES-2108 TaxID=1356359 RepID=A0A367R2J1_NOSPU|nr:ferredoxin [Nostoc punctiforme NIES-2108]